MGLIRTNPMQNDNYSYPNWAHSLGQTMAFSLVSGIFFWMIWLVIRNFWIDKKVVKLPNIKV